MTLLLNSPTRLVTQGLGASRVSDSPPSTTTTLTSLCSTTTPVRYSCPALASILNFLAGLLKFRTLEKGKFSYGLHFSISPSNEHPGLISFRIAWLDLLEVQGTLQESSPTPQFKSINSSVPSFLYSPTLTSIHDYWKNQSLKRRVDSSALSGRVS